MSINKGEACLPGPGITATHDIICFAKHKRLIRKTKLNGGVADGERKSKCIVKNIFPKHHLFHQKTHTQAPAYETGLRSFILIQGPVLVHSHFVAPLYRILYTYSRAVLTRSQAEHLNINIDTHAQTPALP